MENFYEVFGLPHDCKPDDIKKRYRELAMKFHPDRNPNDKTAEESFKKIQTAYEVLSDQVKRNNYDRVLEHERIHAAAKRTQTNPSSSQSIKPVKFRWHPAAVVVTLTLLTVLIATLYSTNNNKA